MTNGGNGYDESVIFPGDGGDWVYALFSNRESMRAAYLLSLIMLLVPLSGCSGFEDDNSRVELASGIVHNNNFLGQQDTLLVYQLIRDYEDSQEAFILSLMSTSNLTYEEALLMHGGNATHDAGGRMYEGQWGDYEEYGWEIDLVSGKGTWNVFWHDREATIGSNHFGAAFWDDSNNSFGTLNERGMNSSGSKERVDKPEQTCSGDPENGWMTTHNIIHNCEEYSVWYGGDIFTFMIESKSDEEFTLEWKIFGWK